MKVHKFTLNLEIVYVFDKGRISSFSLEGDTTDVQVEKILQFKISSILLSVVTLRSGHSGDGLLEGMPVRRRLGTIVGVSILTALPTKRPYYTQFRIQFLHLGGQRCHLSTL